MTHRVTHSNAGPIVFMIIMLVALCVTVLPLASCVSTPSSPLAQIAVQYATAKTIEQSDTITPAGVIRYVGIARGLLDDDVVLDPAKIADGILQALDAEQLSPADRVLAQALVLQIQAQFNELNLLDPATRVTLLAVLDWIELAARMSQ
jgi:hypothetical protein